MWNTVCDKKGVSMLEVLIAIVLTSLGVLSLLALQPTGWKSMAKADYVGRAAEVLYNRMQFYEAYIANPCNPVTTGTQNVTTVTTSGGTAIRGDITYTVNATITLVNADPQAYSVWVNVIWPGNTQGLTETMTVVRQGIYRFPAGCPDA